MIKPITPDEVADHKISHLPDFVFEAFNDLIAKDFNNGCAKVTQDDAIDKIMYYAGYGLLTRAEIFEKGYLNVEDAYRKFGWRVEYDKPGYNESYGAFFKFRK